MLNRIDEEKQYEIINKILDEEYRNKELVNHLRDIFAKKGLPINIISTLFSREQDWQDISKMGQIGFVDGCYNILKWDNLKLNKWYSDVDIASYMTYSKVNEEIKEVYLPEMIKLDEMTYIGAREINVISKYLENLLFLYNKETQRASKYTTLGTSDKIIRTISFNQKAINEMKELIKNGNFEYDLIVINVLLINKNNDPRVEIKSAYSNSNIYNITITPDYDINSNRYTVINLLDGFHRCMAFVRACEEYKNETGEELTYKTPIKLVMRDLQDAKRIVGQTFKRSDTDKGFVKAMEVNDYTIFLDGLMKKCKTLSPKKVADYYDDYLYKKNSYTHKIVLLDGLKKCKDIPFNKPMQCNFVQKSMAKIIDLLINYLCDGCYNGNIKEMINNSNLMDINIFLGYIAIADVLKDIKDENELIEYIQEIGDRLYLIQEENKSELEELKLTNKKYNANNIFNYFKKIAMEVVNNEK